MATLREYFLKDFAVAMTADATYKISSATENGRDIDVKIGIEVISSAKFIAYYVPSHPAYLRIFIELIDAWPTTIKLMALDVTPGFVGDIYAGRVGSTHTPFSTRIYIYSENMLTETDIATIDQHCKESAVWLTIRGNAYLEKKQQTEKPLAFISHDSRDKTEVAARIAVGLQRMLCPVWYDEYALKVGDNLRETIERGLKETKKCILILSANFLANNGWTKTEFDSVFTREILEGNGVLLPVWYNVSQREVYEYSPSLANKVAVNWNLGLEEVVRRLYRAIMAEWPPPSLVTRPQP